MSMITSYQERRRLETTRGSTVATVATVGEVFADGVTLILPGESVAGDKRYPYNAAIRFSPGQRVHLAREGGTVIVEYPLGGGV